MSTSQSAHRPGSSTHARREDCVLRQFSRARRARAAEAIARYEVEPKDVGECRELVRAQAARCNNRGRAGDRVIAWLPKPALVPTGFRSTISRSLVREYGVRGASSNTRSTRAAQSSCSASGTHRATSRACRCSMSSASHKRRIRQGGDTQRWRGHPRLVGCAVESTLRQYRCRRASYHRTAALHDATVCMAYARWRGLS